jgi:hypothetical protein
MLFNFPEEIFDHIFPIFSPYQIPSIFSNARLLSSPPFLFPFLISPEKVALENHP